MFECKVIVLLLAIPSLAAFELRQSKDTTMFEKDQEIIRKNIAQDGGRLCSFFQESFKSLGSQNRHLKPSEFFKFVCNDRSIDAEAGGLLHMPLTHYIHQIIKPHFEKLDKAFTATLDREKDVQKTWTWFDGYFKKHGLEEPLQEYIKQLAKK